MLLVTIEVLPGGRVVGRRVVATVAAAQVRAGPGGLADYGCVAEVDQTLVGSTWVRGHDRAEGPLVLLRQVLAELSPGLQPPPCDIGVAVPLDLLDQVRRRGREASPGPVASSLRLAMAQVADAAAATITPVVTTAMIDAGLEAVHRGCASATTDRAGEVRDIIVAALRAADDG